ncbi:MAG TPA: 3-isopropylmalate dehydratase small subunit [Opitutae bacterium]|nr:3-isopropylmalate dehydratase small subunit [Opitutae bacterium]|tara:strand:+ start:1678 stop:2274 length:597 start_codon:yes stop_codon:yes gene_type:complete
MALPKIVKIEGQGIYVPGNDIDTDRIIPARFMKCVTFDGLGEYLFHDIRYDEHGNQKEHALNDPKFAKASIMLSDMNFGCGSSREHAPQSLYRAGFRAIIAGNFAEIFFGNATNLGIPCVSMAEPERNVLAQFIEDSPNGSLVVDVDELKVRAEGLELPVDMRPGARDSLMNGRWDPLDELLQAKLEIENISKSLPYV